MIGDCPGIGSFLPRGRQTIYNNYGLKIDSESAQELESFIDKLPGLINVSMDGATVNDKQKVCYTTLFFSCV